MGYLFTVGRTYSVHNNMLNIHALVPSTDEGDFEEFLGRSGRSLLDYIQAVIKKTGENYLEEKKP